MTPLSSFNFQRATHKELKDYPQICQHLTPPFKKNNNNLTIFAFVSSWCFVWFKKLVIESRIILCVAPSYSNRSSGGMIKRVEVFSSLQVNGKVAKQDSKWRLWGQTYIYINIYIYIYLYNKLSYAGILIGSHLWSIGGQTYRWPHH